MAERLTHLDRENVRGGAADQSVNPSKLAGAVARFPKRGTADIGRAAVAARAAFPSWSHASREVRSGILLARKSSYGAREQGFAAVEFYTQTKTAYIWS